MQIDLFIDCEASRGNHLAGNLGEIIPFAVDLLLSRVKVVERSQFMSMPGGLCSLRDSILDSRANNRVLTQELIGLLGRHLTAGRHGDLRRLLRAALQPRHSESRRPWPPRLYSTMQRGNYVGRRRVRFSLIEPRRVFA